MHTPLRLSALCLLMLQACLCFAHPPGLSSVELQINGDKLTAKITYSLQDIEALVAMDSDLDAEVSTVERETSKSAIALLVAEQFIITNNHAAIVAQQPISVNYDNQNNVHIDLLYSVPLDQELSVQSKLLYRLPENHQQFIRLSDGNGLNFKEKMLGRSDDQFFISTNANVHAIGNASTFGDFFELGVEHIVTGYDHLLFLFALLAVTHSFWPAIKIITFFTLAHSITLAMAGLGVVNLPSSFVEPFIAATIVYVAVENIVTDSPKGRHWLTFGFGLIHGFGFASVLSELDIAGGNNGILLPLLSFNLGIESGQIAVTAIVLPIIWQLNNRLQIASLFLRGCSLVVASIGGYWFIERTLLS